MRIPAYLSVPFAALLARAPVSAQTPYPALTIQDVAWTEDIHLYTVTQPILSPASPDLPVTISEAADAEFVSSNQVRLQPGFHAGGFGANGRFRAHIDETLGPPGDVVIIAPDPSVSMQDNVIQVPKWEKFEIGLRLPQEYRDAIDRFFANYYGHPTDPYIATLQNVDQQHDLNPFADDSLQLVMTLTNPSGTEELQWGFYMHEAKWASTFSAASLLDDVADIYHPYTIRYRFAPDIEGTWSFNLSIKAPNTNTMDEQPLPNILLTGYSFHCAPPLPDNRGPLLVEPNTRRTLKFANGDPFFAIGPNISMEPIGTDTWPFSENSFTIRRGSYDRMIDDMNKLHSVGGNFMRTFLGDKSLGFENVNLGVYHKFQDALTCGTTPVVSEDSQHFAWVFDQILDHARAKGIYVQACATPYPPIVDYETFTWHNDAYLKRFVEQTRHATTGNYDMAYYFYLNGDPNDPLNDTKGPYYFWKRRYKYLMSRWGYSVNMPIIEHFNEIDQMLTYADRDLSPDPDNPDPEPAICDANKIFWHEDGDLPELIFTWFGDIGSFIRGTQVLNNPAYSPLGDSNKLFLISYASGDPIDSDYFRPFSSPHIDLLDLHRALDNSWDLNDYTEGLEIIRENHTNSGLGKPYNRGEFTTYGHYTEELPGGLTYEYPNSYKIFDHYNVSFHNELWSSAFAGGFAAGTSWVTKRIFRGEQVNPPLDFSNPAGHPLGAFGYVNQLYFGPEDDLDRYANVKNSVMTHPILSLTTFLSNPSVQALELYSGDFTPRIVYDDVGGVEAFYLINSAQNIAVGWVHNINAYWRNAVYFTSGIQNYMDCTTPSATSITLPGFLQNETLYTSFFPTRLNSTEVPMDDTDGDETDGAGNFTLDLISNPFNGTFPLSATATHRNHLDTLHSDYAFIIAPTLIKSLQPPMPEETPLTTYSTEFLLYPNPARDHVFILAQTSSPKRISIADVSGRAVLQHPTVTDQLTVISTVNLARGVYWVSIEQGEHRSVQKLIIH